MDNKQIALSDVERYKELFEYEMTDVILQLRGEFAKVSGKDLNLEHVEMSAPSVDLETDFPNVKLEPIALETQETIGIACDSTTIPSVAIDKTDVSCPTVPVVNIEALENVQIYKSQLNCPAVNIHISSGLKKVLVEKTSLSPVNTDITVPRVHEDSKAVIRTFTLTEIDGVSAGVSANIPNVGINTMLVDVPDTAIKINSNVNLDSPSVEIDVPVIHTIPMCEPVNVSIDNFTTIDLQSIPMTSRCEIKKVDTVMPTIDAVDTDILSQTKISDIAIEKIGIDAPNVERFTIYKAGNPELSEINVDVPKINGVSIAVFDDLTFDKIHLDKIDVEAPMLNANLASSSKISVRMPSINIEYPTVSITDIPDVDMKKSIKVEVPRLHDFSDEIQEIIDTAV